MPLAGRRRRRLHRATTARCMPGVRVRADRRPHDAPPDRPDRIGRPDGGVRRRSDPDDGAHRRSRGSWATTSIRWTRWRSRSAFVARGHRARVRYLLRARSGDRRRHHSRERTASMCVEPVRTDLAASNHRTCQRRHRHHRRLRPVRHGRADRSRRARRPRRRSAIRPGRTSLATLRGRRVAFLARHGAGHRLLPSELNFRANIYGFKMLGVEWILSASAVGSLREDYKPLDLVVPDSVLRSHARARQHVLRRRARRARRLRAPVLRAAERRGRSTPATRGRARRCTTAARTSAWKGRSSRRWPSRTLYRSWGVDIIGMTNLQEAKLAREAEICYATLALVTDYDCWHPDHDSVTVEMIIANLIANAKMAQQVIADAVERLPIARTCECARALATAIITRPEAIPAATKQRAGARSSGSTSSVTSTLRRIAPCASSSPARSPSTT